jgi:DNA-binding CsgD family transcriptional regulator
MASGLTSAQTGLQLGISIKTVETHRKNLQRKYHALNACQLVYLAAKAKHI